MNPHGLLAKHLIQVYTKKPEWLVAISNNSLHWQCGLKGFVLVIGSTADNGEIEALICRRETRKYQPVLSADPTHQISSLQGFYCETMLPLSCLHAVKLHLNKFGNAGSSMLPVAPSSPSTPLSDIAESEKIWRQMTERESAKLKEEKSLGGFISHAKGPAILLVSSHRGSSVAEADNIASLKTPRAVSSRGLQHC
uniref:Uncharacterized protein n=1 Tax=Timema bartmani TaxID=61472 RepID=A0A7R9EX66_9NEOP|nr:unnamed protein product [Timema bartmani]